MLLATLLALSTTLLTSSLTQEVPEVAETGNVAGTFQTILNCTIPMFTQGLRPSRRRRARTPGTSSTAWPTGTPPEPPPGQLQPRSPPTNSHLSRFACYQGYYLVGPPKIVCRYGRWFSDVPADRPTCKPVVCSHPK